MGNPKSLLVCHGALSFSSCPSHSMFAASSSGERNGYMSSRFGVWILPSGRMRERRRGSNSCANIEKHLEQRRARLIQLFCDQFQVFDAANRERGDTVGSADLDHVGKGDAAGGAGADQPSLQRSRVCVCRMERYPPLFSTKILTRRLWPTTVCSSWTFIWRLPSPARQITRPPLATATPIEAGRS